MPLTKRGRKADPPLVRAAKGNPGKRSAKAAKTKRVGEAKPADQVVAKVPGDAARVDGGGENHLEDHRAEVGQVELLPSDIPPFADALLRHPGRILEGQLVLRSHR